jgi:hypothetical protein
MGSIWPHKNSRPAGISRTLASVVYGARAAEPTKPAPPKVAVLPPGTWLRLLPPLLLLLLLEAEAAAAEAAAAALAGPPPSSVRHA